MDNKLEDKLFKAFPKLFPNGRKVDIRQSLMGFGFEVNNGWFQMLWNLCEELNKMKLPKSFAVQQVKEKFGGLRFYISSGSTEIFDLIRKYEEESYNICEDCGKSPAYANKEGWVTIRCKECWDKKMKKSKIPFTEKDLILGEDLNK